jgi:type I restriction enzyme R subunit
MSLEGIFRRRRLPHWDVAEATYFITTCLAGSIPAAGLKGLNDYRLELDARPRPAGVGETEWEIRKHKLIFARLDQLLDEQPAVRWLEDVRLAREVCSNLRHFAGDRYDLLAFVVMPSHFHWLIRPTNRYCNEIAKEGDRRAPRERIMQSVKGYAARQCNLLLGRSGTFWQDESYDHCVRDNDELLRIVEYIERNPVKAKLVTKAEEWEYSSAFVRAAKGGLVGEPLV